MEQVVVRLFFLATWALCACGYEARFKDCAIACTASSGCPDDFTCGSEGACRAPGAIATCSSILDGGPDAQVVPSCVGVPATCGPAGTSPCCSSSLVPGGTFYRNHDVGTDNMFPGTALPATVSSFRLDTYEVTIGRFRQFVNEGMGTQASPPAVGAGVRTLNGMASQGGWDSTWNAALKANTADLVAAIKAGGTWTDTPGANENLPVNVITWFEAFAFCSWDGGFLPTQAEENFAAAGGSQQRAYPWSNPASSLAIDCAHANYDAQPHCVNPPGGAANRVGSESPEGDGAYGQADLGGNVAEWMLDYVGAPPTPCTDCATLTPAANRIIRGGSWYQIAVTLRTARPDGITPAFRGYDLGVRCARSP